MSAASETSPPATAYTRFIIRAGARTGSTMLVRALNSHPRVRCFGELFNAEVDFVPFEVEGYDNFSARDRSRRDAKPGSFLRERVFCEQPAPIRAVGFKLLYAQNWRFPGLIERLAEDEALRVLHLRRRNLLRALVSWKIAEASDVWVAPREASIAAALTRPNALRALRHPLRAGAALLRRLRLMSSLSNSRPRVTLAQDECASMFRYVRAHEARSDEVFRGHASMTLFYEDLVERVELFDEVQSFLGVERASIAPAPRRQNPQPLRELLANYDELRAAFRGTEYAAFFEERPT